MVSMYHVNYEVVCAISFVETHWCLSWKSLVTALSMLLVNSIQTVSCIVVKLNCVSLCMHDSYPKLSLNCFGFFASIYMTAVLHTLYMSAFDYIFGKNILL